MKNLLNYYPRWRRTILSTLSSFRFSGLPKFGEEPMFNFGQSLKEIDWECYRRGKVRVCVCKFVSLGKHMWMSDPKDMCSLKYWGLMGRWQILPSFFPHFCLTQTELQYFKKSISAERVIRHWLSLRSKVGKEKKVTTEMKDFVIYNYNKY